MHNLYCEQEATIRTAHTEKNGFLQECILFPYLFNLYAKLIIWKARLDSDEGEVKIDGSNTNNLRHVDDTILLAESSNDLKRLLIKVREGSKGHGGAVG